MSIYRRGKSRTAALRPDDLDQLDLERQVLAGERVIAVHGDARFGDSRDPDAHDASLIGLNAPDQPQGVPLGD